MAKLEMYQVTLQLIVALKPLHAQLRKQDREQARQLKDASNSVLNNIAEGARREGRDRNQHWLIAAGSADEVRAQLDASVAWGDVDSGSAVLPLQLIDRVLAMLWRATHRR